MIIALVCVQLVTAGPAWWLALKSPRDSVNDAYVYDYADSTTPGLVSRRASIEWLTNLLHEVMGHYNLAQYCDGCEMGLLVWNDQEPEVRKRDTTQPLQRAHAKGFLVLHRLGAFLLTHSAPKFPFSDFDNVYPGNALPHAQHFFYAELATEAVEPFARKVLLPLWPKVQIAQIGDPNGALGQLYPWLKRIILSSLRRGGVHGNRDRGQAVRLKLSDGTGLLVFTKPAGRQISIYEAVTYLLGPILVQTWIRGSPREPSSAKVRRVCNIRSASGYAWVTSHDHSKYFVSKDDKKHYVGVGDLNRQFSQWGRGGSVFILDNQQLSQSVRSRFISYDQTCAEEDHVCTYPMVRDPSKDDNVCNTPDNNDCGCKDVDCCKQPTIATVGRCVRLRQQCVVVLRSRRRRSRRRIRGMCVRGENGLICRRCRDNDAGLQSASRWSRYSCADSTIYCRKYPHVRTHCRKSCHVCKCRDDDAGLQSKWGSRYRCASSAKYCRGKNAKIMWGLCPVTCHICNCQDDDVGLAHHGGWAGYTCASSIRYCSGYADIMHVNCRKSCQVCDSPPAIIHDELRKKRSAVAGKCPMESNCAEVSSSNAPCAVVIGDMSWTAWDEVYGIWVKDHCVLHAYEQRDFHGAYQEFYPGPHAFASRSMRSVKCACGVCAYAQLPNSVMVSNSSRSMAISGFHVALECAPGYVLVGSQPRATVCDVDGAPYDIELAEGCAPYGA